jgi:hypothetical protein
MLPDISEKTILQDLQVQKLKKKDQQFFLLKIK